MRTDIHSPSKLVPADYTHVLSFAYGGADGCPPYNVDILRTMMTTQRFFRKPSGGGGCDVCGAHFRYGDVFRHESGEHIKVGWECAEKIDSLLDRSEAKRAIGQIKDNHLRKLEQERKAEQAAEFLAQHDGLQADLEGDHYILRDMKDKVRRFGSLSDKQVALARKIAAELRKPEKPKADVPQTESRVRVTGRVISMRFESYGYNGGSLKMLVEVDTDSGSYRLWGTCPDAISFGLQRGDLVAFTAKVQRSDKDPSFGFYSRPTKPEVFQTVPTS